MKSKNSVHQQLDKVRKPRVHITYDVETDGATQKKELPFVVGVMGDFSADGKSQLKPLKERKFIQVDGDNFDEVMKKNHPSVQFKVDNLLENNDTQLAVDLKFNSMEDFEPAKIAEQIEPLRKLMEIRSELSDLLSKADRSDGLEQILESVLQDDEKLANLSKDLGLESKNNSEASDKETDPKGDK